jgi:hypothetical protein
MPINKENQMKIDKTWDRFDEDTAMRRVGGYGWAEPFDSIDVEMVLNVLSGLDSEDKNGMTQRDWMMLIMEHTEYQHMPVVVATEIIQFIASHRCVAFRFGRDHLIECIKTAWSEL